MTIRKYFTEFGLNMVSTFSALLQQEHLDKFESAGFDSTSPCHIYMVTRRPRVLLEPTTVVFEDDWVSGTFSVQKGMRFESHKFRVPNNLGTSKVTLECPYPHTEYLIHDDKDRVISSGKTALLVSSFRTFSELLALEILYIGQSYGVEGSRRAPKRLKSHATLQGIYSEAIRRSPDQEIWLVLWSFEPYLYIAFDPTHDTYGTTLSEDDDHIHKVIKNDFTEQQQINFTEAALIRYFEPEYNKLYKDSFPNPAHKTYSECYELDINSVAVELNSENIMCQLWSPTILPDWTHFIVYQLHSKEERKSMFNFFGDTDAI